MIGRRHPRHCSGSGNESGVDPETPLGAELDGLGGGRADGELTGTVEGDDRAVEPDVDLDEAPGIAPAAAAGW